MLMDFSSAIRPNPYLLAKAADLAYPGVGVSTGKYGAIIHVPGQDIERASAIFTNWDSLLLSKNKGVLIANGVDEVVVTLATADTTVAWAILKDGMIVGEGTADSVGGIVSLEFSTGLAGNYQIWIFRQTGNYASGHVEIVAG
jgi:hypothetical protein